MNPDSVEPPSRLTIDFLNRSDSDVHTNSLERGVRFALTEHGLAGEVCVVLTSDQEVQELNAKHRNLDEPTDVLTFPSAPNAAGHLGDIVIAVPFAARQAKARSVNLDSEIAYLGIHGALHLAGFDDEDEMDRALMQQEMARIAELAELPADPDWSSFSHFELMERAR